jgi:DNA-binding NarL/FixJ family response regulator
MAWTIPQTDEMLRLSKAGYPDAEIARRLGVSVGSVRKKRRHLKVKKPRRRPQTPAEAMRELEILARVHGRM